LNSADPAIRAQAARIVADAAPDHPETVRRLLDALGTESDSTVHIELAGALADVVQRSGRDAEVIPSLIKLSADSHGTVRVAAAMALARSAGASTAPVAPAVDSVLRHVLRDPDLHVRAGGATAIGALARGRPQAAVSFAPDIAGLAMSDRVVIVRLDALEAFTLIPASDSLVTAVYRHALRDEWPQIPTIAVRAISNSAHLAGLLGDSVVPLLSSEDLLTRYMVVKALASATAVGQNTGAVAGLRRAASDPDSGVRAAAKDALTRLGVRP
jgi:HEAT repeat protein